MRCALLLSTLLLSPAMAQDEESSSTLRGPDSFAEIADEAERSAAIFTELGKVIEHPRCVNCHPRGEQPMQGESISLHQPPVERGSGGMGVPGMQCTVCHGQENANISPDWSVPGNPAWHLAPASMGWVDVPLADICEQLKDPERNGGKSMEQIVEHMAEDELVAWGWEPGNGREPAPGDQATAGALTRAWVDTGAHCPPR